VTTRRQLHRIDMMNAIILIGRRQLTESGAANLSLRAIARDIGVVSSAVYRYVPSRDDLLTELIVDAYEELGDHVGAADDAAPADDPTARLKAVGAAMRAWALREPARYALIHGNPVPGYRAPSTRTDRPGLRVVTVIAQIMRDAERPGQATPAPPTDATHEDMDRLRAALDVELSDTQAQGVLFAWSWLLGWINNETFGHLSGLEHLEELFDKQLDRLTGMLQIRTKT
jgi:AcrR family transcriptional regulator